MKKDLISIIVPCYNASKFLDATLNSIASQTYKNFEVILVNDGSKDDTLNKLKAFCEGRENFKIIDQQNQGVSQTRNNALAQAQGEFIYFCDSDDILNENILEVLHSNIVNHDVAVCAYKKVGEKFVYHCKHKQIKQKDFKEYEGTENILVQLLCCRVFWPNLWNKMYRHEILKKIETYPNVFNKDLAYGEDLTFNAEYMAHCQTACYTSNKLYFYRQRGGSEVHSKFSPKMLSVFKGHERIAEICKDYEKALVYSKAFKCISCVEMLFRICVSKFNDLEEVRNLYKMYKENVCFLKKAKKVVWYKRKTIPPARPFIRSLISNKLKKKKKD